MARKYVDSRSFKESDPLKALDTCGNLARSFAAMAAQRAKDAGGSGRVHVSIDTRERFEVTEASIETALTEMRRDSLTPTNIFFAYYPTDGPTELSVTWHDFVNEVQVSVQTSDEGWGRSVLAYAERLMKTGVFPAASAAAPAAGSAGAAPSPSSRGTTSKGLGASAPRTSHRLRKWLLGALGTVVVGVLITWIGHLTGWNS